jgi:hypothetical protein
MIPLSELTRELKEALEKATGLGEAALYLDGSSVRQSIAFRDGEVVDLKWWSHSTDDRFQPLCAAIILLLNNAEALLDAVEERDAEIQRLIAKAEEWRQAQVATALELACERGRPPPPPVQAGWRPIEEAPLDEWLLLWANGCRIGTKQAKYGIWAGPGGGFHPTHWMPLPAAPNAEGTS